jgi:protein-disulfide reductase (glutathione)
VRAAVLALVLAAGCSSRTSSPAPGDATPAVAIDVAARPASPPAGWNDAAIAWLSPDAGLAEARGSQRPVCLVVFTTWCPRCAAYSQLFHDPRVVAAAKHFVMIRVDADANEAFAGRFAPDGEYIPRTLFLAPDGALKEDVRSGHPRFAYYYGDEDPAPLLAAMARAR